MTKMTVNEIKNELEIIDKAIIAEKDQITIEIQNFYDAQEAVYEEVQAEIMRMLEEYDALRFRVRCNSIGYVLTKDGDCVRENGLEVEVQCNEDMREDNDALHWSFRVTLRYGKIEKSTNSWSGLAATTPEQLRSLHQTVAALDVLNECVDWEEILFRETPNSRDFRKTTESKELYERKSELKEQLRDAQLEEVMGQDKLVKVRNFSTSGFNGSWHKPEYVYVQFVKATPKQYYVNVFGNDTEMIVKDWLNPQRVSKDKICVVTENGMLVTSDMIFGHYEHGALIAD